MWSALVGVYHSVNCPLVIWCDLVCFVTIHLVVSFISSSPNMCTFWYGLISCPFLLVAYLLIISVVCTKLVIILNNKNGRPCILLIIFVVFWTKCRVLDNKSNSVMINCNNNDKWVEQFFFLIHKKPRNSDVVQQFFGYCGIFHCLFQNCDPLVPKLTHINKAAF